MLWVYPFQTFPRALTTLWPLGDQVHQVLLICIKRMMFQTKDFLKRYPDGSCMTDFHLSLDIWESQMLRSAESSYLLELQKNSVSRYVCFTSHTRPFLSLHWGWGWIHGVTATIEFSLIYDLINLAN